MLMSPNKGQTAIHSRHCPHYMAVRMRGLEYECTIFKIISAYAIDFS